MVITSWNDKNMDWNNPNPYKLEYITALYQAVKERYVAVGLWDNVLLKKPTYNTICNTSYLNDLIKLVARLLESKIYIDGDFIDYGLPKTKTLFQCDVMPKLLDASNFKEIGNTFCFQIGGNCLGERLKEAMKVLKKTLSKFRYTTLRRNQAVSKTKILSRSVHDPQSVNQAVSTAKNSVTNENVTFLSLNGTFNEFGSVKNYFIGNTTTHYNDYPGYCGYAYVYYAEIETFFEDNYAPDLYCYCYSTKLNTGQLSFNYMSYLEKSSYWSGSLGVKQGFNKINLGHCGKNKKFIIGKKNDFAPIPATPHTNFDASPVKRHGCVYGSRNYIVYICDWGVDGGFKFK